jgi:2,4-dienoyl-CoA reductase-like NADH-dependent reductase (Old Yellow Enzyme family)/thioredoxin reductase
MSQQIKLNRLFSPIKIGRVELKNRIIMAPMVTRLGSTDGFMTEREKNYFIRRAEGGTALITVGNVTILPHVEPEPRYDGIWDDKFLPTWREYANVIHGAGSKISLQLCHVGNQGKPAETGIQPVAPSAIVSPLTGEMPRELTKKEIKELVEKFAEAAVRARDAGADMVEIQGVQGFLVQNFMTPLFNKRTDEYGGDLKGRIKFPVEIVKKVKEKAGSDYPVVFRMVASDLVEGGITLEEAKLMAPMLAEAGVDALHFTAGAGHHVRHLGMPPSDAGRNCIVDLVAQIKRVVDVPVMVCQRIVDPVEAEKILRDRKADIISLGRALINDPDWPRKAAEGAFEDIRICIGCCQGCYDETREGRSWTCIYNPEVGKEKEYEISRAEELKKVLVIGGGPGGLEVARVAALRGHEVTLYDKGSELGGQWLLACIPPGKQEYMEMIRWYVKQLEKLSVKIILNKTVTPVLVEETNPDVVIVATGAVPIIPEIPGVDRKNVVTTQDILSGKINGLGDKLVVIGGGMVGCETAEFLAEQGKKVTITSRREEIATDVGIVRKPYLMQRLSNYGVEIIPSTWVEEIAEYGIIAKDKNGQKKNVGVFDTIVLSWGVKSFNEIAKQIEGKVSKVYVIGDALEPHTALEAIAEGARVGREI